MEIYTGSNLEIDEDDKKMLTLIDNGDKQALEDLMNKYYKLVKMKSSRFFMYGADSNDIIQEGMIGLYKAIKDFNVQKNISFKTFANLCIERQLITAIKTANRNKHLPLNSAISINYSTNINDEDKEMVEFTRFDTIDDDPSEIIVKNEYYANVYEAIDKNLSKHEKDVLVQYQKGKSYAEIAEILDCKPKSVDTAMTRIRKKANRIKYELNQSDF